MKTLFTNSNDFSVAVDFKIPGKFYQTNSEAGEDASPFDTVNIEPGSSVEVAHTGWTRQREMSSSAPNDFNSFEVGGNDASGI